MLFSGRFEQLASLGTFFSSYDELALGRLLLIIFLCLLLLAAIPAYIAHQKGRNFWDWWLFGVGLFPVALVVALLMKETDSLPGAESK